MRGVMMGEICSTWIRLQSVVYHSTGPSSDIRWEMDAAKPVSLP